MKEHGKLKDKHRVFKALSVVAVLGLFLLGIVNNHSELCNTYTDSAKSGVELPTCPLVSKYLPDTFKENEHILNKIINDGEFRNQSVVKMQKAVRIDTSSYDDLPLDVGNNLPKFAHFNEFHSFLQETFPLFHEKLELNKINHFGLVYIWHGSDSSLKPLLLMAHQDVVPINADSLDEWVHPPFSADYDGKYIYGRGAADCKNLLIGHFEAVEELIKINFKPRRTVIFSYGFDEEIMGARNENGKFIEQIYGKDSIYAVMDEGGVSMMDQGETTMAVVGTGEKGYLDISISIAKTGGHSSVPQDHTAIGIMGDMIVQVENCKFPTYFTEDNPTFYQYVCLAEKSVDIEKSLKYDILHSQLDERSNLNVREFLNKDRFTSYAIKTTQALDVIQGGVKVNALPEFVDLKINSRVTLEENIEIAFDKFLKDTELIANKYNLGLNVVFPYGNGTEETFIPPTDVGVMTIKPITILEPSPITPVNDNHWEVFAGTVRHIYEDLAYPGKYANESKQIVVTPGLGTGNTDTKLYWNLTDHIYRYRQGVGPSVNSNSHGINEYIEFDSHLQIIAFIFEYIQSVDEVDD